MKKQKTYYLTLSQVFPTTHIKAGEKTGFEPKLMAALINMPCYPKKIHTIRANYEFWRKRFEKIEAGEAILSIRQWVGKPYREGSTQKEITRLTREDGIGMQKLEIVKAKYQGREMWLTYIDGVQQDALTSHGLANNDGLDSEDWVDWFKDYDTKKPLAIIHFTKFRY